MEAIEVVTPCKLSQLVRSDKALIIDSRTFCEFNTSHILNSVNVWSSKIRKKRLQQDSISVHDYLAQACHVSELRQEMDIIVYDQNAPNLAAIPTDSFLHVLLTKLGRAFPSVYLLAGGFLEFQARYPELCEDSSQKCTPLTTQSQPCMPVANVGPTRILPFLYLGSQHDANNRQLLSDYSILYELNVSVSCPRPDFVQESHFMRIPVNDNFSEKLLPYFNDAFNFIDKVRESGGSVLVHCLAGISRSATVAIAYVMKHLSLPFDEAYMYVKTRRPTISPNINFVGQLAELDRQLRREAGPRDPGSAPILFRSCEAQLNSSSSSSSCSGLLECHSATLPKSLSLNLSSRLEAVPASPSTTPRTPDLSPSTALARLSFASALEELRDEGLPPTPRCPGSPASPQGSSIFTFQHCLDPRPSLSPPIFSSIFRRKESSSLSKSDYQSSVHSTSTSTFTSTSTSTSTSSSSSSSSSSYHSTATISVGATTAQAGHHHTTERAKLCLQERERVERGMEGSRTQQQSSSERRRSVEECKGGVGEGEQQPGEGRRVGVGEGRGRERQVSVCVIEVQEGAAPVRYVRSEPLVVRETPVLATPVNPQGEVRSTLQVELEEDGRQQEHHLTLPARPTPRTKLPCPREEAALPDKDRGPVGRPPREVIVPIQVVGGQEGRPRLLELQKGSLPCLPPQPSLGTTACTALDPSTGVWTPHSPQEGSLPGPGANSPGSPGQAGVQQSDSGILVGEGTGGSPQRLPRCHSSSETHLHTRRLLDRHPEFSTRKCSSYDEVGRGWPPPTTHPPAAPREVPPTWLCPWELARSDSVSTSGFGSEISDADFLQEDGPGGTVPDDALGPYEAVFADVFPGESRPQPTTPRTPRPASLPGVTGAYFSQLETGVEGGLDLGVELRVGGRGRRGVEKKDSGYYSLITEHPPVSPRTMGQAVLHTSNVAWPKEQPQDSQTTSTPTLDPRPSPEKRKSRGSSVEENEEKRRSCEVEPHQWSPPPSSLPSGVVRAGELLRGVERLLDAEMAELRRCTAAMSSRLRLLGRGGDAVSTASSSSSSSSGRGSTTTTTTTTTTRVIPTTLEDAPPSPRGGRARSEPPFPGEEGLYRARSCPGLPPPPPTVPPDTVRLRGGVRGSGARGAYRYSCGALDQAHPTPAVESCPDLAKRGPGGGSLHSSSSSLSSTHSSFTRLLQVS